MKPKPITFVLALFALALCGLATGLLMPKSHPPPLERPERDPSMDAKWLEYWKTPKKIQKTMIAKE